MTLRASYEVRDYFEFILSLSLEEPLEVLVVGEQGKLLAQMLGTSLQNVYWAGTKEPWGFEKRFSLIVIPGGCVNTLKDQEVASFWEKVAGYLGTEGMVLLDFFTPASKLEEPLMPYPLKEIQTQFVHSGLGIVDAFSSLKGDPLTLSLPPRCFLLPHLQTEFPLCAYEAEIFLPQGRLFSGILNRSGRDK